jgi:hypothetical protein
MMTPCNRSFRLWTSHERDIPPRDHRMVRCAQRKGNADGEETFRQIRCYRFNFAQLHSRLMDRSFFAPCSPSDAALICIPPRADRRLCGAKSIRSPPLPIGGSKRHRERRRTAGLAREYTAHGHPTAHLSMHASAAVKAARDEACASSNSGKSISPTPPTFGDGHRQSWPRSWRALGDERPRWGGLHEETRVYHQAWRRCDNRSLAAHRAGSASQASLFYEYRLEDRIPKDHLLRRINVFLAPILDGVRERDRDPELIIKC